MVPNRGFAQSLEQQVERDRSLGYPSTYVLVYAGEDAAKCLELASDYMERNGISGVAMQSVTAQGHCVEIVYEERSE